MVDELLLKRAGILIEALPYIQQFYGKTIVIKYGGAAMVDPSLKEAVMTDIVLLRYVGIHPVVVHGGGAEISELMKRLGKEATFVNGMRVTDAETMEIAEMVLVGKIGKEIVQLINQHGGKAVGLCGKDAAFMIARKMRSEPDIGLVGEVERIDPAMTDLLATHGFIPVISSVAGDEKGNTYNINADIVAGQVASALGAVKLIALTDVQGVLKDIGDPESLIPSLSASEVEDQLSRGVYEKGMIPKLQSCLIAVRGGVERAHIIDGRIPHAILMEVFTDAGIGTMITQ
ncbi:MAG: acetylglutamate kinase [Armatimonadetes bacterium CG2_30_59_28]|nr:acetylglutamate kinase [Armatimonadota bacterium]OIO90928.1 MAG: acetylglutamate kinase [Armatimonadetes bacterium CG2_30_59_28]PIU66926.1 MAG: acetylglutamate kinase [Armatimonadetes bacterium CG07_land_8_20_14_0_80_59_28]